MSVFQKYHVQQHDQSDCGTACLLSVIRFWGGDSSIQHIRELSGTDTSGVSMLGLYQAAKFLELDASGFIADIDQLKELDSPCILHLHTPENHLHFVVCYRYDPGSDSFEIGDPALQYIEKIKASELDGLWKSNALLLIKAGPSFSQVSSNQKQTAWKWLYEFTRSDFNLLYTSLALGVFVSALALSTAVFSQKLVDKILPTRDSNLLILGCGLLLFLLLVRVLFSYLRQSFLLRHRKEFNIRILDFFYNKLMYLPKPFFDNHKTGDMIARMNDTARIQATISSLFSSFAIEILLVIASTVTLFVYNVPTGILSTLWIPVFGYLIFRFHKRILTHQRKVMAAYAANESQYIDAIQGMSDIKAAVKEHRFLHKTRQVYSYFQISRFRLGMTGLKFGTSTQVAGTTFMVGMIFFCSMLVIREELSIGAVIAIIQLLGISMASVAAIASAYVSLLEARVALDRMKAFTALKAEFEPGTEQKKKAISTFEKLDVDNLSFRFTGRPLLLEDISMSIQKGEIISIMGESGCGKSTLVQILQGFYKADSGSIVVNNVPLSECSLLSWRKLLGVVPQDIKIFNGSLLENITLAEPTSEDATLAGSILKKFGLDHHFQRYPAGMATMLGESGISISEGEKQMLGMARTLYREPQILLLDELTSAMDSVTEQTVLQLLHRLKREVAIILITHRIKTASIADRIYLIEQKTVTHTGNHKQLMSSQNFYSNMVREIASLADDGT